MVLWVVLAWNVGAAQRASAQSAGLYDVAIDDAPAAEALVEISERAEVGIIYSSSLVRGKRVRCHATDATVEQLLGCVLDGTGLTYRRLPSGALTIVEMPAGSETEARSERDAEPARLSGIVTDASDGQALEGATAALYTLTAEEELVRGTATDKDGFYLIRGIDRGRYLVSVSFVGYESFLDTLAVTSDERMTATVSLVRRQAALGEVHVRSERDHGMARVSAGHQRIRARDAKLAPSPDLSTDLAGYLTMLPGAVTTGSRGGQGYIRGGDPSQNLVLLDGMVVYQPFHALEFYSAFPSDIVRRADVHAGGFPARYSGRLSSVIDVAARSGNNRRFGGMASASPFISAVRVEGPIVPEHASFLIAVRESMLERGGASFLDADLPVRFGDVFANVYGPVTRNSRLSVSALRTHDRSALGSVPSEQLRWRNEAVGVRWTFVPSLFPVITSVNVSRSRHHTEFGPEGAPLRRSTISHTRVATYASFEDGPTSWEGGWEVLLADAFNYHEGLFALPPASGTPFTELGFYAEPTYELGHGLRFMPSARLQWYQVRIDPLLEPRLRLTWDGRAHRVSGALGLVHQEVVGITDRRDVANTFTVWSVVPRADGDATNPLAGRLGRAVYGMMGYRGTVRPWLDVAVETYYKHVSGLLVAEWTPFSATSARLHPAGGRTAGLDARLEIRRGPVYAFLTYGLASTRYRMASDAVQTWFGDESLTFRPPHDRRHKFTALVHASWRAFDLSARWTYGSGLPFTHPLGVHSVVEPGRADNLFETDRTRRVIYDRPFGATLPGYHRLDVSIERSFALAAAEMTLRGSVINVYDRRNVVYVDAAAIRHADQIPFMPSVGLRVQLE